MNAEMSAVQIREAIVKMSHSKEYLALRKYYSEESFFKTLGISRSETVHSSFIAWLLNPMSNHELAYYPLQKFLQMLAIICQNENNSKAQFSEYYSDRFLLEDYELSGACEVNTEVSTGEIAGFDNKGRIDILAHLSFKDSSKVLPILIENKVLSRENDENKNIKQIDKSKQTEKYFNWANEKYKDTSKYETPILIFLAPDFDRDIKCKCEAFIKVSYQNLVDYLIEPCLISVMNNQARVFIENYLRCLSNTTLNNDLNKKEGTIMAIVGKERELLEKFHEKNKDLFNAVLTMLSNDEDLPEEDRNKIKAACDATAKKDYTKYSVDGSAPLSKRRCVLEIVRRVAEDKNVKTYAELVNIFPNALGAGCVVRKVDDIKDASRFFAGKGEVLDLDVKVAVSNQWSADTFPNILKVAQEQGLSVIAK